VLAVADVEMKLRLLLALAFGLRAGEISEIKRSDVDFENKTIKIHRLKKKSITCSILKVPDDILMLIEQMPKADGDRTGYVFKWRECRKRFKQVKELAGIDANFRFHDLRHTAASWQLQDGATLETIRKFLAHTDISTTARYLHSDDRDVDQASARTLESLL